MRRASVVSFIALVVVCVLLPAAAQPSAGGVRQIAQFNDPPDFADDQFGFSVAIAGNLVAVGAPSFAGDASYVYLYRKQQTGWSQAARLDDGGGSDQFGWSVAVSSDVVAVGTPHAGKESNGAVFVFIKPAGGWKGNLTPTAELTVPPVGSVFGLGSSLVISPDGTTIVAGAPGAGNNGATFVFVEPAGGWANMTEPTASLTASLSAGAGYSVAMSGGTIAVGSDDPNLGSAVYIFVKPTGGWVSTDQPDAALTASDETEGDTFGSSVAIEGNTVVVGSPRHPNFGVGAAYVFVEPPTGWKDMTQTAELGVKVNHPIGLGGSVAIEGNVMLAGAPDDAIGQNNQQGAVFGYVRPASGWQDTIAPNGSVSAQSGKAQELFGATLAISGNTFVTGAPYYNGMTGAAYIFQAQ